MIQPPETTPHDSPASPGLGAPGMASTPAGAGIDLIKLKQYLHIVVRRIWIVAICFIVALVMAVFKVSGQEATYRASVSILLTRGMPLPGMSEVGGEAYIIGDFIDTQVRIMNSRKVRMAALEKTGLSESEFNRLYRSMGVNSIGKSSIIAISVESLDGQFSSDYANALAAAYIDFKDEERVSQSQNTSVNLMQQANKIRDELRKAEDALILYKKENSMVITERGGNVAAGVMGDLTRRTAAFRMERMILELQRPLLTEASDDVVLTALSSRYVPQAPVYQLEGGDSVVSASGPALVQSSNMGMVDFDDVAGSTWQDLRKRKSDLEQQLREARETLRDSHPTVRNLLEDIRKVDGAIDREVRFATERYYSELEALSLKESSLERVRTMWLEEAVESELVLDRYSALQNDVDRLKKLLETVFARIREVDISSGIIPDTVTVIEAAVPSGSPVTPRKIQTIFMAGLIGMALGIGIIFGLDFLDDSFRYPEEIPKVLGLRFLGLVPAANWSSSDIRTHLLSQIDPKSGLAESYRNIRAILMQQETTRKSRTMLVSSSVPKEGKTTTSLNMAISFAQAGMRVLIVDADLRRGEVHKYFGLEGGRGLADVLNGQAKAESVIQRTGVPNLDLVATGPFPQNPAELMLRPEFRTFIDYARRSYDKIIFDGPPVMAVSESGVLASLVDSTIMVIWAGNTSRKLCQVTVQNLLQRGARIDGCILNNLEFGRVGYYYYSTYYGYYTYDYRYDDVSRPG